MGQKPLVSIGMPVFNGEKYIRQALDSLLSQDYGDFELIISDNASTDETGDICRQYMVTDSRIQFYRNEANVGSLKNFRRVLDSSSGTYFMWAADHDLWHKTFVSQCVSILEEDQQVAVAYARTMLIDPSGTPIGLTPDQFDTRGMSVLERFEHIIWRLDWCNVVYGVTRRSMLQQVSFRDVWGPDHLIIAELCFQGTIAHVPEPLFFRRKNREEEWGTEDYKKRVLTDLYPGEAQRSSKTYQELFRELRNAHFPSILRAPMSTREKTQAIVSTFDCFSNRFGVGLSGFGRVVRLLATSIGRGNSHHDTRSPSESI